jgi:ornithine decarboxylase
MAQNNFCVKGISLTLQKLRHIISHVSPKTSSLAILSGSRLQTQLKHWSKALPKVEPFYAVKCNPEEFLLESLTNAGVNFDCASLREVDEVKRLSWPDINRSPDILYAHPLKSEHDIQSVKGYGVNRTVVDSVEECKKLVNNNWKGDALLRIAVSDAGSKMPFSAKFGASRSEVEEICRRSKIPLVGVSFHVGSGCEDDSQYAKAIEYASTYVFDCLKKYSHNPSILDIGGGYNPRQSAFQSAAAAINGALANIPDSVRVIAEPGRYFAQTSQDLFVRVIAKKPGLGGKGWRYVIDESVYSQFSCIPFDHQQPAWFRIPSEANDTTSRPKEEGVLFGRTCDSLDVIAKGTMERLEVGDWLYFPFMGAYTSSTASEFNGFPKPKLILDTGQVLPEVEEVWPWIDKFYANNSLTYTNSLPPIL